MPAAKRLSAREVRAVLAVVIFSPKNVPIAFRRRPAGMPLADEAWEDDDFSEFRKEGCKKAAADSDDDEFSAFGVPASPPPGAGAARGSAVDDFAFTATSAPKAPAADLEEDDDEFRRALRPLARRAALPLRDVPQQASRAPTRRCLCAAHRPHVARPSQ